MVCKGGIPSDPGEAGCDLLRGGLQGDGGDRALEQPGSGIVVKGFVSEEELAALYAGSRLVVVPLRYGAGVKGKVVEAVYNGSFIVTTSIGAEGIPEAGDIMRIADEPEDFAGRW